MRPVLTNSYHARRRMAGVVPRVGDSVPQRKMDTPATTAPKGCGLQTCTRRETEPQHVNALHRCYSVRG